jgi:hypothetical protein
MLYNMYIDALECEGAFHLILMVICVRATANWSIDHIICWITCILMHLDVKGHSTQCNFFPLTGKNRIHVPGCRINDQRLSSDFIELCVVLAIVKCEDQFTERVQLCG